MTQYVFLARQLVVDVNYQLIAYELLFRDSAHANQARLRDVTGCGIEVITHTLCNLSTDWVLGDKLAFINMDAQLLMSEVVGLLPPAQVVLEVLATVPPEPAVLDRLRALKRAGFRIALDDYVHTRERAELLPLADYVKVDVLSQPAADSRAMIEAAHGRGIRLIAKKVETPAQFEQFKRLKFDYFQGYYFARPENLTAKVINPTHAAVLHLLDLVQQEADVHRIEAGFKRDVALTFKLLRYINSAAFGLACEVQSIRHAVNILGYRSLNKWLTLLLATANPKPTASILTRTAITRGRLCELLGGYHLPKAELDNLFITGVFSLLDALLETPMEQVLERCTLPQNIIDALLHRSGVYGPILALAEACERDDPQPITRLAEQLLLTPQQVNQAHLEALAWVERLGLD